jgi:hypothetical protein
VRGLDELATGAGALATGGAKRGTAPATRCGRCVSLVGVVTWGRAGPHAAVRVRPAAWDQGDAAPGGWRRAPAWGGGCAAPGVRPIFPQDSC